jgi:hypothetical protein
MGMIMMRPGRRILTVRLALAVALSALLATVMTAYGRTTPTGY